MPDFRRDGKLLYRLSSVEDFVAKYGVPAMKPLPQFIEETGYIWTKVNIPANGTSTLYVLYAPSEPPKDPFNDGSEIAFYRFNGNANDEYGNYNGTWSGNEQYGVGVWGQGARFDGSSYVSISEPLTALPFTISLWLRTTQVAHGSDDWHNPTLIGFATLHAESNDFGIEIKDGKIGVFSGFGVEDYYYTNNFVSDNRWHNVVVIFDTDKYKIYLDRNLLVTRSENSNTIANVAKWYIGVMYDYGGPSIVSDSYYNGLIDNLRIFNRALSDEEVQQLYELEKPYIVSNGDEVFEFFDDFDGDDLDTTYWNKGSGSYTVENGYIKMWGGYDDEGTKHRIKQLYHSPFRIVWKGRCSTSGDIDCRIALYKESDSNKIADIGIDNEGGGSEWYRWVAVNINGTGYHHSELAGTEWRLCDTKIFNDRVDFTVKGLTPIIANYDFNSAGNLIIGIYGDSDASDRFGYIDYIGIAKLTDPEPSITYGNEETGNWIIDGVTYTKRKKVIVTNSSSSPLLDYQVRLSLEEFGTQQCRVGISYDGLSLVSKL